MSSNYVLFVMAFVSLIAIINVIYINNLKKAVQNELERQRIVHKNAVEIIHALSSSVEDLFTLSDFALRDEKAKVDKDLKDRYDKTQEEYFRSIKNGIRVIQDILEKPIVINDSACECERDRVDCSDCEASFTERARQMSEEDDVKQESKQEVDVNKGEETKICVAQETKNEDTPACAECEHTDTVSEPKIEEKREEPVKAEEAPAKESGPVKFDGVIYPVAHKEFFEILGSNLPKKEILPYITEFIEKTVALQKNKGVVADHIAAYLALRVHDISDVENMGDQRDAVLKTYNRLLGFMYSVSSNKISHSTDKSMKLKTAIHKQYRYSYRLVFKAK